MKSFTACAITLLIASLADGKVLAPEEVASAPLIAKLPNDVAAQIKPLNVSATMLMVDNIETYQNEHPDEFIEEIPRSPIQPRVGIQYTVGNRVGADYLVAQKTDSANYGSPNDVVLTLTYPANGGQGAVVTYVLINVNQSNYNGRAFISAGGIGQRYIRIIVEAKATNYFQYQAYIYGYY